jgi:hypothetical protein
VVAAVSREVERAGAFKPFSIVVAAVSREVERAEAFKPFSSVVALSPQERAGGTDASSPCRP